MKNKIIIVKTLTFISLVVFVLIFTSSVLKDKENYIKYDQFYSEPEDFDVLFFGSSKMLLASYPTQLYENFGITSYNMAQHAEGLKITAWQIKNALQYTKPEVIVVDVSLFWSGKYTEDNVSGLSYLHKSLDHMKISKLKYDAIKDNVADEIDIKEYLFPILLYHSRWDQLSKKDFCLEIPMNQGAESKYGFLSCKAPKWENKVINTELSMDDINLEMIYQLCNEKNISLVLTYLPIDGLQLTAADCANINQIELWAESLDIPFLNIAMDENLINYQTDLYDEVHVNRLGASKITEYLGNYLVENYEIPKDKNEIVKELWSEKIIKEHMQRAEEIKNETTNLYAFLTLIADGNYSYVISVNQEKAFFTDTQVLPLFEELGVKTDLSDFCESKPNYTFVMDARDHTCHEFVNDDDILIETSIGEIEINYDADRKKVSKIAGYVYYETIDTARVDITVFDAYSGAYVTRVYF